MGDKELREVIATDGLSDVWDDNSAFWNNEIDQAVPQFDRWNDELRELLSDEEKPSEHQPVNPEPVVELRPVEPKSKDRISEEKIIEPLRKRGRAVTDKQLFLIIKKYKQASIICDITGMTLQTLRNRVGHLSYKLKRYVDVEGLYRETSPVELKSDGIKISTGHLVESDFKSGDRFRVDFEDKYIILARLPKSPIP